MTEKEIVLETIRALPDDCSLEDIVERIEFMAAVQKGGRAYLSNATVNGKFALRACITNFRTTKADIEQTLNVVRATARQLGHA